MEDKNQISPEYHRLLHEQHERLKELGCINQTTYILKECKPIEETLQRIVLLLPAAWQYPKYTEARIIYRDKQFETPGFRESRWKMEQEFNTIDDDKGIVQVYYTEEFRDEYEGPFLKEERDLILNIANLITGFINSTKARDIILGRTLPGEDVEDVHFLSSRQLLQKFLERHNAERDVFHDLQPFKVKEILLVANLYDAYSIEGEGRFVDHMLGEYHQMSLTSLPRLTGVSGEEEAFNRLKARHYDMVIIMVGLDKEMPVKLCRNIKYKYPYMPVYLLLNYPEDVEYIRKQKAVGVPIDNYFVWTGESKVFFAMVNLLEDRVNVDNDTKRGLTGVILLVEDSAEYYSSYLPMLYTLVMEQTRNLIEDVSTDELYKVLKLKTRPKILLALSWEDAITIFNKYEDNLLCVISDICFPRNGKFHDTAGYELIQYVKTRLPKLPTVIQSSDPENARYAYSIKSNFINKNSEGLMQDLKTFINYYLGFGHFVYRDDKGRQIAVAKSMKEFEAYLETIPEDSLEYHALGNHFSQWLMARGEVKIAWQINPIKVSDFKSIKELREYLLDLIRKRRREQNKGRVVNFEESALTDESNVVSLSSGSLGGKGRGLAFINTLIYSFELGRLLPGINVKTPITAIIGTDEFDMFMERNHFWDKIKEIKDYPILQKFFIEGSLSYTLEKELRIFLKHINKPLAVRSSSLFEDSLSQPFSGIFDTYILPNNHPEFEVRLKQLTGAIKLVFSSIYSKSARTYFEAINYKIELEKMAVVIQEVAGNRFDDTYYPHISGTAQSFNFYPVSHMKPEDGVAVVAVGMGHYVAEGDRAFRFSPVYPNMDVISHHDLYKNSQVSFYAVDMSRKEINLLEGEKAGLISLDISEAEKHGTLNHTASVLNIDNDTIVPGLDASGPRVINFADILKYDYMPLASTLNTILEVVEEAIGNPSEIEFAVDLTKDKDGNATFYLLQIKPLTGSTAGYDIDLTGINNNDILLKAEKSMGNGILNNITDVVYVEPEKFDNLRTLEMADEVERINDTMAAENRSYILIGPGRWGTKDRFLGIPVVWPQISHARVIVEVGLRDFYLDASLGSHFFHNVTAMNVGYFSVNEGLEEGKVDWEKLKGQELVSQGDFFRHIRFEKPLLVRMDGKKGIALITINR
ncbi:MAG TPA: PEP/pyruvate-binding domain-containing protein [Bacteroidales bacterium]|nr:PEP/pyruvate-binding domain-containing protein [Bacteroidales bacterium]HPM86620.1 PEP/pyruvate-binding domain-containing protein [Bacteroidales bacterium]